MFMHIYCVNTVIIYNYYFNTNLRNFRVFKLSKFWSFKSLLNNCYHCSCWHQFIKIFCFIRANSNSCPTAITVASVSSGRSPKPRGISGVGNTGNSFWNYVTVAAVLTWYFNYVSIGLIFVSDCVLTDSEDATDDDADAGTIIIYR